MTTTTLKPYDVISDSSMQTLRSAVNTRRTWLLEAWKQAFDAGILDDNGCAFWSERIQQLNDTAIEIGMGYELID